MRIRFEGKPGAGVTPKDIILYALARLGADVAAGCALEFAGKAIRAMPVEGRLTAAISPSSSARSTASWLPTKRHMRT